ncbi:hypothetical protein TNCV_3934241 [Trichonephila clavipes]|nr:hypothetical protein TNCV_3934241 [Trichonephila clavipes]
MYDPSSFANPTPLAHADTSRDVLLRGALINWLRILSSIILERVNMVDKSISHPNFEVSMSRDAFRQKPIILEPRLSAEGEVESVLTRHQ